MSRNCDYCGRDALQKDRNCFGCGAPVKRRIREVDCEVDEDGTRYVFGPRMIDLHTAMPCVGTNLVGANLDDDA